MRIQHNIAALNSYRNLTGNNNSVSKNLEKLSSGYRINRAGDDAAGLAISEKMRAQITGLDTAQKNANDGISLVQTAEGAMTEVHSMLNRMVELADQSANGTYQDEVDRENLQKEITSLKDEIDRISDSTNFNGINLLDGSLEAQKLSKVDVVYNTETAAAGVTVNKQDAGTGSKGEYSVDLQSLYGTGDTIKFSANIGGSGANKDITLTYGDKTDATTFTGATLEDQAQSIADALKMDADVNQNFDVTVDGTKVTLTSKVEGTDGKQVTGIQTTDKTVSLGGLTATPSVNTDADLMIEGGWNAAFGGSSTASGIQPEEGDILTFTFKGSNGEDFSATVEITKDMLSTDVATTTANIVNKLNQTKFNDDPDTAGDESALKVSDLFDVTANIKNNGDPENGSIQVGAKKAGDFQVGDIILDRGGVAGAKKIIGEAGTGGVAATDANEMVVAAGSENFTAGDKFTITGTLSDGKTFSVELEAGKDFEIGTDLDESMDAIIGALSDGDSTIQVNVGDKKVDANKVFGATSEFSLVNTAGELTITSNKAGLTGAGVAGNITNVSVTTTDAADAKTSLTNGARQGSAVSSVTLDNNIEYGTAIKIGDKTYEIVEDSRDVSNRNNIAVQISDLKSKSASEIAKALTDTVNGVYGDNGTTMTAAATGSTVTFTSNNVGSNVAAIEVSTPYGDEVTTASFQFDPSAVKEGSTFTFNGNSYQFVKTGEKAGTGKTAIEVADFDKATSKSLGDAFAAVAKNGTVKVADDGTVTLRSAEGADGTISKPEISFYDGLSLQIGDTSDSFNQLSVSVKDMHASSLGIGDVDISTQAGAKSAIDKIKGAINNVSSVRGDLGAIQNRLEHTINNLSVTSENMTAAESRIRDVDMAQEMMNYTKNNILVQASQAMLAQANQIPQGVLQLLQ